MKLTAYSVFDKKVGLYATPFFAAHEAQAMRSVQMAMRDPQSSLSVFPTDYSLYSVGEFDEATGYFTPSSAPLPIIEIVTLVETDTATVDLFHKDI